MSYKISGWRKFTSDKWLRARAKIWEMNSGIWAQWVKEERKSESTTAQWCRSSRFPRKRHQNDHARFLAAVSSLVHRVHSLVSAARVGALTENFAPLGQTPTETICHRPKKLQPCVESASKELLSSPFFSPTSVLSWHSTGSTFLQVKVTAMREAWRWEGPGEGGCSGGGTPGEQNTAGPTPPSQ